MRLKAFLPLAAVLILGNSTGALAQTATVDGVGSVATGDATYPNSYATLTAALAAYATAAVDTTITITANELTEPNGTAITTNANLIIQSTATGGVMNGYTLLRYTPSGVGSGGTSCCFVYNVPAAKSITFKNLIICPSNGAAGFVESRVLQVRTTADVAYTVNMENCMITAVRPTGHASAGTPILDPMTAAETSRANRLANLRAFSGGSAAGVIEIRAKEGPATDAAIKTFNYKNVVITHTLAGATAASGCAIGIGLTQSFNLNVNEGCVISYCDQAGIRSVGTLSSATTAMNILGTSANPVFIIYNGWDEDVSSTGRNEGILCGDSDLTINYAYIIGNHQEGVDKPGGGFMAVSNSYIAENQKDLDPSNGTAPDTSTMANLKFTANGADSTWTITNSTIYNDGGSANDEAIRWGSSATSPGAGRTLNMTNVIAAGSGDQLFMANLTTNAVTYTEDDCAIVQAGADSLQSPYATFGSGVTQNVTDRLTADPMFLQTTFTPTWVAIGTKPTGLTNYLAVNNGAYRASGSRGDVTGANAASPLPVAMSGFNID